MINKYFTLMLIPERGKRVKSIRIPRPVFKSGVVIFVLALLLISVFIYDYTKILGQIYENRNLAIENRQLKEQIQLFQIKINNITEDMNRLQVFEKKLRVITGLEKSLDEVNTNNLTSELENMESKKKFLNLKDLYERKMAEALGSPTGYTYTRQLSMFTRIYFTLASDFAKIDYQFDVITRAARELASKIHGLDEYLLDKESMLKSTPTLLPASGWITSYFGPRISPYSNKEKMHEGIDIGGNLGSPIVATADGIVTYVGTKPGFGILVQLDHGYGIETLFAHARSAKVKLGQLIKRGTEVAELGNTGYSTGPHVHYEIRINGTPVDPIPYLLD